MDCFASLAMTAWQQTPTLPPEPAQSTHHHNAFNAAFSVALGRMAADVLAKSGA